MSAIRRHIVVALLLSAVLLAAAGLAMNVWQKANGIVAVFVAYVVVLMFVGLGVTMAGRRATRITGSISIYAAASAIASFAVVAWAPLAWAGAVLEWMKFAIYVCLAVVGVLAAIGWIIFARRGSACFDYLGSPSPNLENA